MALALRCLRPLPALLLRRCPAGPGALPAGPRPAPLPRGLLGRQLATKRDVMKKQEGEGAEWTGFSSAPLHSFCLTEAPCVWFFRGALDHITVVTKDGKFPLNQLGQISQKSPQLMIVNMTSFPESTAAAAKAIRESGMNLNPEVDGAVIRVPVPKVTREHRESLAKLAKQSTNKSKEALRKVRSKSITQIKKSKSKVSEDTIRLLEKQIQQMADEAAAEMDKLLAAKTKELLG
ncbi:ribosome-recycling factor, mitochondrial [Passer montanus]|uniref:ribosome-recycling factor, mitochondrial n=1 Tax=Passer montanus TaxID=9160 RepID=UPI00195FBA1C|nr:ribosome-recycling factor, mitochondrial [Passer montanus]